MKKVKGVPALPTRERILNAAEHLFAARGYDATSLRDIAIDAGTRTGLVSYHFQSKEALYETLISRRSTEIGRLRLELLHAERRKCMPKPVPAERIVYAYTWPFLDLSRSEDPGWASYTKLISGVANSARWASLIGTYYDPVATVFLSEFQRTLPGCPREKIVAAFTFMVSAMLSIAAETRRTDNLSNGALPSTDLTRMFDIMLPFISAGFDRLGADGGDAHAGREG